MPQYVPLFATLCRAMRHYAVLCGTIPCYAALSRAMRHYPVLCGTVPQSVPLCRAMPPSAALCRNLPQFATLLCTDSHYHPINILLLLVSHNYITVYI
jgi:hypothetical protein